jgi:protein tyrosine phosphatase (PTP) superfamily phosphohydrolase (DUF442 family)
MHHHSLLLRRSIAAALACTLGLGAVWAGEPAKPAQPPAPASSGEKPKTVGRDVGHIHNLHEITPRIARGSQPEDENDFAELAKLGVKVVVSVDGSKPFVELAHKHGMRYVHVPMGYDGPTRDQQLILYKAFTTLEGPFFVHCHHGKHRGPAACGIGLMACDGWTADQVVAEMGRAGTARKYEGLYAFPATFQKPTPEELATVKEIPEVAKVPSFVDAMVHIDATWARLGDVRRAGWKSPPEHPDVSPKHEATIFAEHYREMARLDEVTTAHADLLKHTKEAEVAAWDLAKALEGAAVDAVKAEEAYLKLEKNCTDCHKQFRDTPKGRSAR